MLFFIFITNLSVMKTKTLWLITVFAMWALVLAGCNKTEETISQEEPLNDAAQFCIDNWGKHEIVTSETAVYGECTLPDGTVCDEWDYYEGNCPEQETSLPADAKTSLTLEELESIEETNFPKSYTYSSFNIVENLAGDEWEYTYPEDISHTLLIPEHATMASREVISSWIEDGMIYTMTKVTLQDGTVLNVLYIVDPETLNFVAASVENGDISTNYQFAY